MANNDYDLCESGKENGRIFEECPSSPDADGCDIVKRSIIQ